MNKFTSFERKLFFKDVLIVPESNHMNSRNQVNLIHKYKFKYGQEWEGIPLIVANMDTTGTFEMAQKLSQYKVLTCLHKHYSIDELVSWGKNNLESLEYVSISTGTRENDIEKLTEILKNLPKIKWICLDVANGYNYTFLDKIKLLRTMFPDKIIMAGNIVTPEQTIRALDAGADLVKLGIGGGSVCITRQKTGIGYPQLSVCLENNRHVIHHNYPCSISDGGCRTPSDIVKALAAGVDFVMIGGMFSGHDESGGDLFEENGKKYKLFYGMSSDTAMKKHYGSVSDYRTSEGRTIKVEYKGPVENTIKDILGGIRSACTYIGSKNLSDIYNHSRFILI